jgi:hypothetical protein
MRDFQGEPGELRLQISEAVAELLDATDEDLHWSTVRSLVDAKVAQVRAPWQKARTRRRAIERAVQWLPANARGSQWEGWWEQVATRIAAAAIDEDCPQGDETEMLAAARVYLDPLIDRYRRCERVVPLLTEVELSAEERRQLAEKLLEYPMSASLESLRKARQEVIDRLRAVKEGP